MCYQIREDYQKIYALAIGAETPQRNCSEKHDGEGTASRNAQKKSI